LASAKKALQPNRPEDINGLSAAVSQAQANVEDQEAALVQAQANLADANQNLSRYVLLQKDGAVSTQELETRQTTAKVAAANVRSAEKKISAAKFSLQQAQEHLSMAKIGGRTEDIQIANANILEIQGNIRRYRAQLDRTIIKAPVDGIIIKRDAHIGDIAAVGKSMFSMARDNRLELRAQVPEADLSAFKKGQTVKITSALTGDRAINGRLREISPLVDADTRLATVRIDIPTSAGVKPGMYAEGRIDVGRNAVLTVPALSVISEDDKSIVFVLHNNIVESRTVVTGSRTNELVEIKSGLRLGDSVVVTGAGFLKDGDCVSLAKAKS
jgi:HlyD family secretion protein